MKVFHNIASASDLKPPISLAIGMFDGVHIGHRRIIEAMKLQGRTSVIFTFSTHPFTILLPDQMISQLSSEEEKITLLKDLGIDACIIQRFSKDIAEMHYRLFIEELYRSLPFQHLFFGEGEAIGKDREGTPEKLQELGKELHFKVHYLPKLTIDGDIVCSTSIRNALKKGNLSQVEKLLGRQFSIKTTKADPLVDRGLIKPGSYLVLLNDEKENFTCKIDSSGSILLHEKIPSHLDDQLTITLIRKK